jgi:hypothetical protein
MDERTPTIEIEVSGTPEEDGRVALQTFTRAADSLVELLNQIAADRRDPVRVNWLVSELRTGSAAAEVEGVVLFDEADDAVREAAEYSAFVILEQAANAMDALENGEDVRSLLSFRAIERVRALTSVLRDGASRIAIRTLGREIPLSLESAVRAKALLDQKYRSFGSVEGTIETISVHEKQPYFNVFHTLDDYAIKCRSDLESLTAAKASLGSRVRVSGMILRRYDGRVESVEVSAIRVLPDRDQLPQADHLMSILSGGTKERQSSGDLRGSDG